MTQSQHLAIIAMQGQGILRHLTTAEVYAWALELAVDRRAPSCTVYPSLADELLSLARDIRLSLSLPAGTRY